MSRVERDAPKPQVATPPSNYHLNPYKLVCAPPIRVKKMVPSAEIPSKEDSCNVGYDLTLVARSDNRAEDDVGSVNLFETGLRFAPPPGYYLEVVAKDNLVSNGYILSNGVQILDPEDRSDLVVSLYKFREGDDLSLPCSCLRLVLCKAEYCLMNTVVDLESGQTETVTTVDTYMPASRKNVATKERKSHMF